MEHFEKPEKHENEMNSEQKNTLPDLHPLKYLTFSIKTPTGIHELQLYLDIHQYTQKILWDHLIHNRVYEIDTEGAEGAVLKGAVTSLSNLEIPYVICEINRFGLKQMGSTEKELRDFMRELGYDPYLISDQSPHLQKLAPDFFVNSIYVFNLLFSKNNPLETDSFKNNV
jgi:hypothetical protein